MSRAPAADSTSSVGPRRDEARGRSPARRASIELRLRSALCVCVALFAAVGAFGCGSGSDDAAQRETVETPVEPSTVETPVEPSTVQREAAQNQAQRPNPVAPGAVPAEGVAAHGDSARRPIEAIPLINESLEVFARGARSRLSVGSTIRLEEERSFYRYGGEELAWRRSGIETARILRLDGETWVIMDETCTRITPGAEAVLRAAESFSLREQMALSLGMNVTAGAWTPSSVRQEQRGEITNVHATGEGPPSDGRRDRLFVTVDVRRDNEGRVLRSEGVTRTRPRGVPHHTGRATQWTYEVTDIGGLRRLQLPENCEPAPEDSEDHGWALNLPMLSEPQLQLRTEQSLLYHAESSVAQAAGFYDAIIDARDLELVRHESDASGHLYRVRGDEGAECEITIRSRREGGVAVGIQVD